VGLVTDLPFVGSFIGNPSEVAPKVSAKSSGGLFFNAARKIARLMVGSTSKDLRAIRPKKTAFSPI
jgi:hypothetical protein